MDKCQRKIVIQALLSVQQENLPAPDCWTGIVSSPEHREAICFSKTKYMQVKKKICTLFKDVKAWKAASWSHQSLFDTGWIHSISTMLNSTRDNMKRNWTPICIKNDFTLVKVMPTEKFRGFFAFLQGNN